MARSGEKRDPQASQDHARRDPTTWCTAPVRRPHSNRAAQLIAASYPCAASQCATGRSSRNCTGSSCRTRRASCWSQPPLPALAPCRRMVACERGTTDTDVQHAKSRRSGKHERREICAAMPEMRAALRILIDRRTAGGGREQSCLSLTSQGSQVQAPAPPTTYNTRPLAARRDLVPILPGHV
jgi:hypothetical protein